jgi:hypothetical protein
MRTLRLGLVGLTVVLGLSATTLAWLNRDTPIPLGQSLGSKALDIGYPIAALTLVAVAELICRRRPRHVVAWMFLLLGLSAEILFVDQNYGLYGTLTVPGAVPAAGLVMWISTWTWALPVSALVVALLVFPDGRPISPRWWIVAWLSLVTGVLQGFADAYRTPLVLTDLHLDSPLGTPFPLDVLNVVSGIGTLGWSAATLVAGASLVVRFRRASGIERQQLKWVAYGCVIATATLVFGSLGYASPDVASFGAGVAALGVLLIPISAALAILRYRLYDIDIVIERTLVYGATTAAIAVAFFGGLVLLQAALRPITSGSELAVAASTLVSFALFQPIRRWIQQIVDRRFYRSRYDAARTLDAFAEDVRDDVDLESVRGHLIAATGRTMSPAHASLWLRERTP